MAKAVKQDPLIAAVIARLPQPGSTWPAEHRANWLKLMAMTFDQVYGPIEDLFTASEIAAGAPAPRAAPKPVTAVEPVRYYVDKDGRARRDPGGIPIKVGDVPTHEVLWDERPAGKDDLEAIVWADGTWPANALPPLNFAKG